MKPLRPTLGTVLLCLLLSSCCRPSQAELETSFHAHREALEEILKMAAEDSHLVRIATDFTWLENDVSWPRPQDQWGLSDQRWNRYRRLFEEAAMPAGIYRQDGKLYFIAETCGLGVSGWTSGYMYSEEPPTPLVEEFGDLSVEPDGYVPLIDNWYAFYQS